MLCRAVPICRALCRRSVNMCPLKHQARTVTTSLSSQPGSVWGDLSAPRSLTRGRHCVFIFGGSTLSAWHHSWCITDSMPLHRSEGRPVMVPCGFLERGGMSKENESEGSPGDTGKVAGWIASDQLDSLGHAGATRVPSSAQAGVTARPCRQHGWNRDTAEVPVGSPLHHPPPL